MKNEASFVSISICECSFSNGDTSIIPQEHIGGLHHWNWISFGKAALVTEWRKHKAAEAYYNKTEAAPNGIVSLV